MEENIHKLKVKNLRFCRQPAAKQPMHPEGIPNVEPENINEESRDNDPQYEGLEDSEDIETSLRYDGGFSAMNEVDLSNLQPKTRTVHVASQEGNTQPITDLVEGKTLRKAGVHEGRDVLDEAQRDAGGEDLRDRLSSHHNVAHGAPSNGNCRMNQESNETRQVTPPKQWVTPTTNLNILTMIHNLRNKVSDLRKYGEGGQGAYEVTKENLLSFMA